MSFIRDSHWLIIQHDFSQKASVSLPHAYLSKYDALYAIEKCISDFMKKNDGQNSDTTPRNEIKIVYTCKNNISDPGMQNIQYRKKDKNSQINDIISYSKSNITMEKTYIDELYNNRTSTKWLPYGHYVVRNANEHIAKYTIWKKEKIEPDGYFTSGADKCKPIISLELVEIPNNTYNNLADDTLLHEEESDETADEYNQILTNGLVMTNVFTELNNRFSKESKSVSEIFVENGQESKPGKPSAEQLKVIPKDFYEKNVDSGHVLSISTLRMKSPSEFITWRCSGKSKGHWTAYIIAHDDIIME